MARQQTLVYLRQWWLFSRTRLRIEVIHSGESSGLAGEHNAVDMIVGNQLLPFLISNKSVRMAQCNAN